MADFKSLVNDPAFQSLSREDQTDLRQRFYEKHIRTDPGFQRLPDADRLEIQGKVLGMSKQPASSPAAEAPPAIESTAAAQPPKGIAETIFEGVKAVPGAIADFATEFGKAAVTPPKEGRLNISNMPQRVADLFKGVASGASAGIYQPEAQDEAERARHMLGSLAGFAVPFSAGAKAARLAGAGKVASHLISGAGTGAIAPAIEGDLSGAITGAGAGAALVGGAAVAGRLFRQAYGRAPKDVAEIKAKVTEDPSFRKVLADFPDERLGVKNEPIKNADVGTGRTITEQVKPEARPVSELRPAGKDAATRIDPELARQSKQYLEEFIQPEAEARRVATLERAAVERATKQAQSYNGGKDTGRGVESLLARDPAERANYSNVDYRSRAIYDKARAEAADAFEALRVRRLGLKTDDVLSERVGRALFGEPMDATAEKLAGQLASSMDKLRVRADVAGMSIPKRKDFGLPQVHDVSRIASAPKSEWVEYTAPRVKRIYGEEGVLENPNHIRGYLEKVYDAAVEDAATLQSGIRSGELKLQSESRRIIFRNYNDWAEYSERFGHGEKNLLNIVDSHLHDLSRQTALVEILGPRPRETLNKLMDTAARKGQLTPFQRNRIERLYSVVSGEADGVQSQRLANTGAFIRSWLASAQLGSAPISAMSDIVTGTMARKANGMPLTRGIRNLFRGMSRPEAARMAIAADASLLQLQQSKFGDFAGASKGAGRGADFTLRASGLTAWTEAGRRAFGVEFLNFLGNHVKSQTPFARLPRPLQRQLPRYGLEPEHWDNVVLKAATIQKHGASFLDLDSFGSLVKDLDVGKPFREAAKTLEASDKLVTGQHPKAAVQRRLAGEHARATEIQQRLQTIRDVEVHLREMLATESEFAMISGGDARVKALTTFGAERGTLLGELGRTGLLYKSFPLSLLFTHLQRGLHQPTMAGKLGYLGPFVAASTIVGALSIQARELVKGRTPRKMDEPSFWGDALSQGGALTVFEGALEANRGFDRVVTQAGGPALGLARDVFDLTAKNAIQASKGKDAHLGREVSRFAERYTPATNLWQSRLITQRFLWNNLQRMLDPEAEESFAKQAAAPEKWGSEYWWAPGE